MRETTLKKLSRSAALIAAMILVACGVASAQYRGSQLEGGERICGHLLFNEFGFSSNYQAREALNSVIQAGGYKPEKFVIAAADVDNALACEANNSRYILFNPSWIRGLVSTSSAGADENWMKLAILAHELGHHHYNHLLRGNGSTPPFELEADSFAGAVLARLGATLAQAQLAFRQPSMCRGQSTTHPGCMERLAAVENGWRYGRGDNPSTASSSLDRNANPNAVRQFSYYYAYDDENERGYHSWIKINETTWADRFPRSGKIEQIEEVGRITVQGYSGVLLRHKTKPHLEYFIPDKGYPGMPLAHRGVYPDGSRTGWWSLGEMKEIN